MQNDTLEQLKRSAVVPSMPQVITRFLEIVDDPDFRYDDLVEVLSTDPGVVADVLRISNSAFFGVTKQIDSLKQALTLLGIKRIRSLVIGRYMVKQIGASDVGPIDLSYFWRRSLATGVLSAKFIANRHPEDRDAAFIAGLLADIGVIIMTRGLGDEYVDIAKNYTPRSMVDMGAMERERFDITHSDVSAMVLEHWKLPEHICQAVAQRYEVEAGADNAPKAELIARTIRAAGRMSRMLAETPDAERMGQECPAIAALAGLDLAALGRMLDEIEAEISQLAAILSLDVIPSNVYSLIAKSIQDRLMLAAS